MLHSRLSNCGRNWGGALLLAGMLAGVSAAAAPSKIRLKLEDVGLLQGAGVLSRASGVPLEVPESLREAPVAGKKTNTTDFDWSEVSFPVALRQLCTRFGLVPLDNRAGYVLLPDRPQWRKGLPLRVQEQEHAGVRLFLANTGWGRSGRVQVGEKISGGEPVLQLTFVVLLGDRERDTVHGLRNVVARDDQGGVLKQLGPSGFPQRFFPDEWAQTITLQGPSAGAKRLVSIEGDLMVYGDTRRRMHEARIPVRGKPTHLSVEGVAIEVPPPVPIPVGAEDGPGQEVRVSVRFPPDAAMKPESDSMTIVVVDAQGVPLPASDIPSKGSDKDGSLLFVKTRRYGPTQAGPARARVSWREHGPQRPLFTLRMSDVPVPARP